MKVCAVNKKINFLPCVVIGECFPIDTLKLQKSSLLSGLNQEVTTTWTKSSGGSSLGISCASPLESPNV